jgi:hypothetical protein
MFSCFASCLIFSYDLFLLLLKLHSLQNYENIFLRQKIAQFVITQKVVNDCSIGNNK